MCKDHNISELRGTVGKVVGSYGGEELMVLDVHFQMDATSYSGLGSKRCCITCALVALPTRQKEKLRLNREALPQRPE